MNICSGTARQRHADVAYEDRSCPVCTALEERDEALDKLATSNNEIKKLENRIDELLDEVDDLKGSLERKNDGVGETG